MKKVFLYELKRLLLNKFFVGLLVITAAYSYQILSGDIIRGVAYTAPFSAWSYGGYLAAVSPLLSIALLFFMTFLYSKSERRVAVLTQATPVDPKAYMAVRYAAMIVGFAAQALLVVLISFYFYATVFRYTSYGAFIQPMLLVFLPLLLFTLGAGATAGGLHPGLLYACMLLALLAAQLPLPAAVDYTGGGYYAGYPLALPIGPDGEPAFTLSASFLAGRIALSALGAAGVWYAFQRIGKRLGQAKRA